MVRQSAAVTHEAAGLFLAMIWDLCIVLFAQAFFFASFFLKKIPLGLEHLQRPGS
jgi:hypothetical protein